MWYVVLAGNVSDRDVIGPFTTEEEAEGYILGRKMQATFEVCQGFEPAEYDEYCHLNAQPSSDDEKS